MQQALSSVALFLASLALAASASVKQDEICVQPPTFNQTIDLERYDGTWYIYLQIPAYFSPDGITCGTANYAFNGEGEDVRNAQIRPNGTYGDVCGAAYVPNPEEPGVLIVELAFFGEDPYWLLDTDYDSFAAVYSCTVGEPVDSPTTYGWLVTRETQPSQEAIDKGIEAFESRGISLDKFRPVPQAPEVDCRDYQPFPEDYVGLGCAEDRK